MEEPMSQMHALLDELLGLGVRLRAESGQLRIDAAKGVLDAELQQRVRQNRDALLRHLQQLEAPAPMQIADARDDVLPFPLSDLQLGFYIANDPYMEFHVRPHAYTEVDYAGLDVDAYLAAWNRALQRHARELCVVDADINLQLLAVPPALDFVVHDLRAGSPASTYAALRDVRESMMRSELPLQSWPWFDLRISRWMDGDTEKARVHYNHNNFFIDGFATVQLLVEIQSYYRDPELRLPPLGISCRDAVLALDKLERSEQGLRARDYWFSRLQDLPPPPALSLRNGMNRRCRSRLERREGILEKSLWDSFKSRCASYGVTPSNAVTTAYAYVLATWSNSDRFILSHMATRRLTDLHPDISRILGNFASLYPLLIDLQADLAFVDNVRRVQKQVLDDMQNLQVGGMRVLQELNRLKGGFGTAPIPYVIGSGLFMKQFRRADFSVLETSQTLLDHQFFELEDGSYYYVWDLLEQFFPPGMIDDMWQAYMSLLRDLAADESGWQRSRFDLVGEDDLAERRARNETAYALTDLRLHEPLTQLAQSGAPFAVGGGEHIGYHECDRRSSALAVRLLQQGVQPGQFVAIAVDRGPLLAVAAMAILKARAAYVPIDPALPAERIGFLLRDASAAIVLTETVYADTLAWPSQVAVIDVRRLDPDAPALLPAGRERAAETDLAYMIYTSGSTGRPKGVTIDHRGVMNTIADINQRCSVGPGDKVLGVSAFNFDLSVYDLFGMAAAGGCVVYPDASRALDPNHWIDLIKKEEITLWNSVPALMSLAVEAAERRAVTLPSLRWILLSGDKIPLDLPDAVRRVAPRAQLLSLGGATEASIWSIYYLIGAIAPGWVTVPYGYPLRNQQWDVLDRHGRPCPRWVPGELVIAGIGLAHGYWNDVPRTERSFPPDAPDGARRYRTGDMGRYMAEGCIEWIGRSDFQVKIQGYRVELGEIEAVLQEHPQVRQAVVTVDRRADGKARLVGHVVADGQAADFRALETFLQARLPAYMVPAIWRALAQVGLTGNGKIDRRALQDAPIDERENLHAALVPEPPRTPHEARLQQIWSEILGRPVGVTDDFFDVGGQSFDAIRIFVRIKEEFGLTFGLSDIWISRTVRSLAAILEDGQRRTGAGRVVPVAAGRAGSPLFLVHPAGGSVVAYSALGRALTRPLYAIQALPEDVAAARRDTVENLARHYVEALRQVDPEGPYTLGGWSSGAVIAFEMAVQLERAGLRVFHLYILDGPVPAPHHQIDDDALLRWFLQDLALGLPLQRLAGRSVAGEGLREQLSTAAQWLGVQDRAEFNVAQLVPAYACFRDMVTACARYSPGCLGADVTVVRVEHDEVEEFALHPQRHQDDWGWAAYCTGRLRSVRVAGTHYSFLGEPLVREWSAMFVSGG